MNHFPSIDVHKKCLHNWRINSPPPYVCRNYVFCSAIIVNKKKLKTICLIWCLFQQFLLCQMCWNPNLLSNKILLLVQVYFISFIPYKSHWNIMLCILCFKKISDLMFVFRTFADFPMKTVQMNNSKSACSVFFSLVLDRIGYVL